MYRSRVMFCGREVEVEAPDPRSLIREMSAIIELDAAREDQECVPFYRHAGGFDFYGLRRVSDGYEVQFGQHKAGNGVEAGTLFAKRRTSDAYVGFQPPRFAAPPADTGDEANGGGRGAAAADRPQPSREHGAIIYYVRRLFPVMRRQSWQMRIDGEQCVLHAYLSTQEGWERLVWDERFARDVLARVKTYEPEERFDVEGEHAREEERRRAGGGRGRAAPGRGSRARAGAGR